MTGSATELSAPLFVDHLFRGMHQCCAGFGCSRQRLKQNLRRTHKDLIQQDFFEEKGNECLTVYSVECINVWPCGSNPPGWRLIHGAAPAVSRETVPQTHRYGICVVQIDARSHVPVRNASGHMRASTLFDKQCTGNGKKPPCPQTQDMAATGAVFWVAECPMQRLLALSLRLVVSLQETCLALSNASAMGA